MWGGSRAACACCAHASRQCVVGQYEHQGRVCYGSQQPGNACCPFVLFLGRICFSIALLCLAAHNIVAVNTQALSAVWCCPTALCFEAVLVQCQALQGSTAGTLHPSLLPGVL